MEIKWTTRFIVAVVIAVTAQLLTGCPSTATVPPVNEPDVRQVTGTWRVDNTHYLVPLPDQPPSVTHEQLEVTFHDDETITFVEEAGRTVTGWYEYNQPTHILKFGWLLDRSFDPSFLRNQYDQQEHAVIVREGGTFDGAGVRWVFVPYTATSGPDWGWLTTWDIDVEGQRIDGK